jgi:oligopeptide transport system substrate-binding protein
MRNITRVVLFLMLVTMLASSFGMTGAQDGGSIVVTVMGQDDIPTLDPSLAEDTSAIQALEMLMPGMTTLNETTAAVEPGIASSWDVSEDGTTYTFHLIPEISWVRYNAESGAVEQVLDESGNPRYVTAQDVVYGFQRSLTPTTLSYYGTVLSTWVSGGSAMIDTAQRDADGNVTGVDEAAMEEAKANLGVTAIDDLTVEVVGSGDFSFLPNVFGMWMARPQPSWAIEEFGEFWTEAENINSYGPFALKEWLHDESVTFIKNPFWAGTEYMPAPALEEVTNLFLEQSAALANYEAGELDYLNPPPAADIPRLKAEYPNEYGNGPGTCTYGYTFNVTKAPFDNVHMRRAFSLALDREAITVAITQGDEIPTAFFTLPNMNAAPQQENYPEVAVLTAGAEERAAAAQAELEAYFAETGTTMDDLPAITMVSNDSETHTAIAQAAQQMFNDVLGIEIQLSFQEWATFLDLRENDAPQIFRQGWCYDFPDAHNWLHDVFYSQIGAAANGMNEAQWANEEFDQIVLAAAAEKDEEARREMYGRAEVLLTWEEAVYMPFYYYANPYIRSEAIEGPISQTGAERFEKWSLK